MVSVQLAQAWPRAAALHVHQRPRPAQPARVQAPLNSNTGIDGLTRWLGLRWESATRVALTVRPDLINAAGLLSGPVAFAMVDYSMGSALWVQRESGERIATINISINYLRTVREGEIYCESVLDRRNDRNAVLRSEVTDEAGRLLATAIGSFSIFPKERLGSHDHGPSAPEEVADVDSAPDHA